MVLLACVAWRFLSASKQAQAGEGSEAARDWGGSNEKPFESVIEILMCGHSTESHWTVLSLGARVYHGVQGDSYFWVYRWNPYVWLFTSRL